MARSGIEPRDTRTPSGSARHRAAQANSTNLLNGISRRRLPVPAKIAAARAGAAGGTGAVAQGFRFPHSSELQADRSGGRCEGAPTCSSVRKRQDGLAIRFDAARSAPPSVARHREKQAPTCEAGIAAAFDQVVDVRAAGPVHVFRSASSNSRLSTQELWFTLNAALDAAISAWTSTRVHRLLRQESRRS